MGRTRTALPVRWCCILLAVACAAAVLGTAPRARAAEGEVTEVTNFGDNPGDLQMFEFIPKDLPADAPLVVFIHGCLSQVSSYDDETGWIQLAEKRKWALAFPQQRITNNDNFCMNWIREEDISRGRGEAASIVSMVRWMEANRGVDAKRVYVTGHSAGGYFTSVMLLTYPDVFRAGAEVSGGPYRCEVAQPVYLAPPGAYIPPGDNATEFMARDECTQAGIEKTPQEWGDLARMGDPGYKGRKPRVALWHGSADATVVPKNFTELVKQWTNYLGIDPDHPAVDDTTPLYVHKVYKGAKNDSLMETYLLTGRDHPYPGDGSADCPGQANDGVCATSVIADWFAAS
jgi:poly(3-hydroxybutyrate) depolymerase